MNFIMISGTLSHDYIKWLFPPRRFLTRCSRKYFDGKFVMDPRNSRRKLVTQSLHIVLSVHVCVLPRKHAHTWPSRNWHVHIGEYYEAQSPLLYIPDACKDLCLSCPCVCVRACASIIQGARGMCRTYTVAPPITLTCKYVICSSDSRYTWLHSVTSTDVESLHPTGSLLLEGEALSSSMCTPVVTHAHAYRERVASHHVSLRRWNDRNQSSPLRETLGQTRDGFGIKIK